MTARAVAVARATMERLPADHGDPDAEDRLARSLSDGVSGEIGERMRRHLQGRTRFFDRVVVNGIARGARQVVIIGAGYDGRSLRYAAPAVRFFEVDRPDTQADKRARLDALGIDASDIRFVAFDLAEPGLDVALRDAGFDPDAPGPILGEGLLVYLTPAAIERTLDAARALAAPSSRLALSATAAGRRGTPANEGFRQSVAAAGEPTRNELDAAELAELLTARRWRTVELPERAARAGFIVAAPVWAPAPPDAPPTAGHVGRYLETALHRRGTDTLAARLEAERGLPRPVLRELDVGVFDTRCADGRRLVVRLFPAVRPRAAVERDAELLSRLRAEHDFPAEAPVRTDPVGAHDGQPLLITEFAVGAGRRAEDGMGRRLGELLGRLHALDLAALPELPAGGAWHHLVPEGGPPSAELVAIRALLAAARARVSDHTLADYAQIAGPLDRADDCAGLPQALVHPGFNAANAIGSEPVIVDWAGCGVGPRLWSLAFLLWTVRTRSRSGVQAAAEAYRAHVELTDAERERLVGAISARPAVLVAWGFATGRNRVAEAAQRAGSIDAAARTLAERALAIL